MSSFMIRTDLALEARESAEEGAEELPKMSKDEVAHALLMHIAAQMGKK